MSIKCYTDLMLARIGRPLLAILFFALVIEIIIIAPKVLEISEEPDLELDEDSSSAKRQIEQSMKGLHLIETRNEVKEWELWADEAIDFKDTTVWNLDRVKAIFFTKDGGQFTVTGDKGIVEEETKNMVVEGNVVTRSSNGYVFSTERVSYDSQLQLLSSITPVKMKGPYDPKGTPFVLTGDRMQAHLEDSIMEVNSNVKAQKVFEKTKKMHINSGKALFSGHNLWARFKEDVVMDLDMLGKKGAEAMRMTGPEALFKYDSKQQQVSTVEMSGGVKVTDSEKWATSEKVKVDFSDNKYEFNGNPRVIRDNEELRGERIVFLDGGKKVKIIGARARVNQDPRRK